MDLFTWNNFWRRNDLLLNFFVSHYRRKASYIRLYYSVIGTHDTKFTDIQIAIKILCKFLSLTTSKLFAQLSTRKGRACALEVSAAAAILQ